MKYNIEIIENGLDYNQYRNLIDSKLLEHKSTSNETAADFVHYTKLNVQRMKRLDKTAEVNPEITNALSQIKGHYTYLVVTEGWCGDASQTVPVINKIAESSNGKISVRFILRDQNLEIIDQYLTNGGRAIPIVIILNQELEAINSWGPRPKELQLLVAEWVTDIQMTKEDRIEKVHAWYAKDRTQATQNDILEILKKLD